MLYTDDSDGSWILFSFECAYTHRQICGDYSGEVTPVPIPNTVVKLLCADDTWRVTAWESKTLPLICFFVYFFGELECSFLFCFDKAFLSIHDTQFHDSMV